MQLVITRCHAWGHANLRTWSPDNPKVVAKEVGFSVGTRESKRGPWSKFDETFGVRVATPLGLATLESQGGIIAVGPIVIMESYDYNSLFAWLTKTVEACQAPSWDECLHKLQMHFNYDEHF